MLDNINMLSFTYIAAFLLIIHKGWLHCSDEGTFGDKRILFSGSSYVIVDSHSLEVNSDEKVEFIDVGGESPDNDGLEDIIGTLKKHTKQVGVDMDGDNVAIGEITADADEDNQIK